jgi:hypothetical protein
VNLVSSDKGAGKTWSLNAVIENFLLSSFTKVVKRIFPPLNVYSYPSL